MANANKNKGKRVEREVADLLGKVTGKNWQRVPNSGAFLGKQNVSRMATMSSTQIIAARGDLIPPEEYRDYIFEVKSRKDFSFNLLLEKSIEFESWVAQALVDYEASAAAGKPTKLFVVFKINQKGMFVAKLIQKLNIEDSVLSFVVNKNTQAIPILLYKYKEYVFCITKFDEQYIKDVIN